MLFKSLTVLRFLINKTFKYAYKKDRKHMHICQVPRKQLNPKYNSLQSPITKII